MRLTDFALDAATGIRLPATVGVPAGYLDGAERELAAALPAIGDRGTGSPELEALVHDWPTLYHLTPYRATIFDCLGFTARRHRARARAGRGLRGDHALARRALRRGARDRGRPRARPRRPPALRRPGRRARLRRQLLRARRAQRVRRGDADRRARVRPPLSPRPPRRPGGRGAREPADRAAGAARRRRARGGDRERARPEVPQRRARGPLGPAVRLDPGLPRPDRPGHVLPARAGRPARRRGLRGDALVRRPSRTTSWPRRSSTPRPPPTIRTCTTGSTRRHRTAAPSAGRCCSTSASRSGR